MLIFLLVVVRLFSLQILASNPSSQSVASQSVAAKNEAAKIVASKTLGIAAEIQPSQNTNLNVPSFPRSYRLNHARELLGRLHYNKVVLPTLDTIDNQDVNSYVKKWLTQSLRVEWKKFEKKIYRAILFESQKQGFDPIFIMAVIQIESNFNPVVRGTSGEIGLMQIMPLTGRWLSKKMGIRWRGTKTLKDPAVNIRLGTTLLAKLRKEFDSDSRLYLAAYNMGSGNVQRALGKNIWPRDYPLLVMEHYISYYRKLLNDGITPKPGKTDGLEEAAFTDLADSGS